MSKRFPRQEWFRYKRLGTKWRKPRGMHSKLREHMGYRINVVSIGYRSPRAGRGLHPCGLRDVMVFNVNGLEGIDPRRDAVRIGGAVGKRKKELIQRAASEKGIKILNATRAKAREDRT